MREPTPAAVEEVALLPCPFCGSEAEIERRGDHRVSTIYQCTFCGCSLETGEEWSHGRDWNNRAAILALPSVEWRTIDSAPRNGEPVTIYVPIHQPDRRILTAYWTDAGWVICSGSIVTGKPTHWKPLDAPPQPVEDRP